MNSNPETFGDRSFMEHTPPFTAAPAPSTGYLAPEITESIRYPDVRRNGTVGAPAYNQDQTQQYIDPVFAYQLASIEGQDEPLAPDSWEGIQDLQPNISNEHCFNDIHRSTEPILHAATNDLRALQSFNLGLPSEIPAAIGFSNPASVFEAYDYRHLADPVTHDLRTNSTFVAPQLATHNSAAATSGRNTLNFVNNCSVRSTDVEKSRGNYPPLAFTASSDLQPQNPLVSAVITAREDVSEDWDYGQDPQSMTALALSTQGSNTDGFITPAGSILTPMISITPTSSIPSSTLQTSPESSLTMAQHVQPLSNFIRPVSQNRPVSSKRRVPKGDPNYIKGLSKFHTGKVRKKFSPENRKEVAAARVSGVCLRCKQDKQTCRYDPGSVICKRCSSANLGREICFKLDISDCLFYRQASALQNGPWRDGIDWVSDLPIMLDLIFPNIPGAPTIRVECRPFKASITDVNDYVLGENIGEKLIVPLYAACNLDALMLQIKTNAKAAGLAYVDMMQQQGASTLAVGMLRGAFAFSEDYPRSILREALELWSCSRMNAYDRALTGPNILGQEPVADLYSPQYGTVPIPPKLDFQCDMIAIEWQQEMAQKIMRRLWRDFQNKDRSRWFEFFLTVFVMLNNLEFVYGVAESLRDQYAQHVEDDKIARGLDKFLQHWMWSAKHLLNVYKEYVKGVRVFEHHDYLASAEAAFPGSGTSQILALLKSPAGELSHFPEDSGSKSSFHRRESPPLWPSPGPRLRALLEWANV